MQAVGEILLPFSLSDIVQIKQRTAERMERQQTYLKQRSNEVWEEVQRLMKVTAPYPADYEGLQRIAAMIKQAQSDKPLKDNHPRKKP